MSCAIVSRLRAYIIYKIVKNKICANIIKDLFFTLYYDAQTFGRSWNDSLWFGYKINKCPNDLIVYQEIIFDLKPDIIIECGTAQGGSALYFAQLLDILDKGIVYTIDNIVRHQLPEHPRINYLIGSSIDKAIINKLLLIVNKASKVLVVLDSDHHYDHVLAEIREYSKFVTPGSYLIVEDTMINGHPVLAKYGPGPYEAVVKFLKENKDFTVDVSKEKHYITFNINGYLRKSCN